MSAWVVVPLMALWAFLVWDNHQWWKAVALLQEQLDRLEEAMHDNGIYGDHD
jgi:hypothetical protein